jgi:hypothetical protein
MSGGNLLYNGYYFLPREELRRFGVVLTTQPLLQSKFQRFWSNTSALCACSGKSWGDFYPERTNKMFSNNVSGKYYWYSNYEIT